MSVPEQKEFLGTQSCSSSSTGVGVIANACFLSSGNLTRSPHIPRPVESYRGRKCKLIKSCSPCPKGPVCVSTARLGRSLLPRARFQKTIRMAPSNTRSLLCHPGEHQGGKLGGEMPFPRMWGAEEGEGTAGAPGAPTAPLPQNRPQKQPQKCAALIARFLSCTPIAGSFAF